MKKKAPSSHIRTALQSFSFRSIAILSLTVLAAVAVAYFHQGGFSVSAQVKPPKKEKVSPEAVRQMKALTDEKRSRTKAQKKIGSQLWYQIKMQRGEAIASGVPTLRSDVKVDQRGFVEVDITAHVNDELLATLKKVGTEIINVLPQYRSIVARMRINSIEGIAARPDIIFIGYRRKAMTNREPMPFVPMFSARPLDERRPGSLLIDRSDDRAEKRSRVTQFLKSRMTVLTGSQNAQSDVTHRANLARLLTGFNGAGITIGVLSDGVTTLAARQASGDLPPTGPGPGTMNVLPGQGNVGGSPARDEGTAMLEIVHDVAPGATLFFATGFTGDTQMAANIVALRAAGCDIIIDDIGYFNETPFQDGQAPAVVSPSNGGVIIQAVNDVTALGALYFSSAGNSGNKNDNQSGVWEGDFVSAGPDVGGPLDGDGDLHDFGGGVTFDSITVQPSSTTPVLLKWSDPLGGSSNDYDLYLLNAAGDTVEVASLGIQDGTQDPIEGFGPVFAGERLVIVLFAGEPRFLHLNTNRGRLAISTNGVVYGHNAGRNTISVGATPAGPTQSGTSFPAPFPFAHFTTNVVELFSSDGPRRIFYNADSTPITPGNFLAATGGGEVLQKPDITAADGVTTTTPGFIPFFGTSASAPQAGAMMALLKDASPASTNAQLITAMKSSALDIEGPGTDVDSGAGIFMPLRAMNALGISAPASIDMGGPVTATELMGNGNGALEPFEIGALPIRLDNLGLTNATAVTATLSTSTANVAILPSATRNYGTLVSGIGSGTATPPYQFRLLASFPCGASVDFALTVTYTGGSSPQVFNFTINTAPTVVSTTLDTTAPVAGLGFTTLTGTQTGRLNRDGIASSCAVPKASPGIFNPPTGSRRFDSYVFTASVSGCVTVSLSAVNVDLFATAYNNAGFNPAAPNSNYLADAGVSGSSTFSFSAVAGQQYTIVVHEVNVGGGIGDNYTLTVQGPRAGACLLPTAGEVSIEGRVLTQAGRGISNATVTLTGSDGIRRTAVTNTFGFYKITDVPVGDSYVLVPISKRYQFTPIVLNVTEDLTGVNFIAENP